MKSIKSVVRAVTGLIFGFLSSLSGNLGSTGAIDLFDTRTMLAALEQMLPPKTFLRDTFFSAVETSNTKYVDIDIMKGKRRLAPFVAPVHEGKVVERIGWTTNTYQPPYVKPKMVTTAQDFLKRNMGDTIYGAAESAMQRAAAQVGRDLRELDEIITRREEWMASQLLQTGQVRCLGEGIDQTINFGMDASHIITLSGTDLWSDTTNATPLQDLRAWRRLILKDSGRAATDVVMGTDAIDAFLAHPNVSGKLDTRRIDLGMIDPREMAPGVLYYGRIKDVNVDLWVYDEWYIDPATGVETPMIDTKKIIMGDRNARTARHYGAIQDLKANAAVPRFPKSWEEEDPSQRFIMVQSAPLLALHQVDAFAVVQVLS